MTLDKLRDELIDKILCYHGCNSGDCPHDKQIDCNKAIMEEIFDAAVAHLSEQAGEHVEPDAMAREIAEDTHGQYESAPARPTFYSGFLAGAAHQFEQDRARIGRAEEWQREAIDANKELERQLIDLTARLEKAERERDEAKNYDLTAAVLASDMEVTTKLKRENASLLDQLKWSLKNEEQYKSELAKLRKEYDDYIAGRPGDWYIVVLKKERDKLKAALEQIANRPCSYDHTAMSIWLDDVEAIARKALLPDSIPSNSTEEK